MRFHIKGLPLIGVLLLNTIAQSAYLPFPGRIKALPLAVKNPTQIQLQFETWPGFSRKLLLLLPNLHLPGTGSHPKSCEVALYQRAKTLSQQFLQQHKEFYFENLKMANSSAAQGSADLIGDGKSLRQALLSAGLARDSSHSSTEEWCQDNPGTQGFRDERHKSVQAYRGPPRTGAQVYAYRCGSCHERTTQGAPFPEDRLEWELRLEQGMETLLQHVNAGYKELMPPRGGCLNCSREELGAAIVYILQRSGIQVPANQSQGDNTLSTR